MGNQTTLRRLSRVILFPMDAEIEDLKVGKSYSTEEVHFSGGLRGLYLEQGWGLFPVRSGGNLEAIVVPRAHDLSKLVKEAQCHYVGACIKHRSQGGHVPFDVWEPGDRDTNGLRAADSWSAVAFRARESKKTEYAECASYVSVCLRSAGVRLRDVSTGYHDQLRWALLERQKVGVRFSNAAMLDLYVDFHSLVSELCSARDHLARLAAIHSGADQTIDSLARLEAWLSKPANASKKSEPLVLLLLGALGTKDSPGWLRLLGETRNEMLHRIPMGRNPLAAMFRLDEVQTTAGPVRTIRLVPNSIRLEGELPRDPLETLSELSANLESLARLAWRVAKFPATIPEFGTTKSASS
jgi:hypothetical protein